MDSFVRDFLLNFDKNQPITGSIILIVLIVWSFIWKGLALWHASRNEEKYWFVAILILNTVGILEIVYLFVFSKQKWNITKVKKFIASYI